MLSEKQTVAGAQLTYYLGGALLLIVASIVILYYLNAPSVKLTVDSYSYLGAVQQLHTTGNPVNYFRLPTYPLFILGVYALTHQGNLMAVSIVQGILFICAALEIAFLTWMITRKRWAAFLVGVLVGTNIYLLYSAKLIMTEGLSLWLLTTVLLSAVLFLKTLRPRFLWVSAVGLLLLLFTRPEWVPFPGMLFLLLIVFTWKKLPLRRVALPVISALAVIYLLVGSYIYVNAQTNHLPSLSWVTNMNLIGKVLQYRMQDESPTNPSFSHVYDSYLRRGIDSPYYITSHVPGLGNNYAQASADWAKAIILHHPGEFLVKSVPYLFTSLYAYPLSSISQLNGKFAPLFNLLLNLQSHLSLVNIFFPLCALIWLALCCSRKTRHDFRVQAMGVLVVTIIYAVIITTLGGYREDDLARVHVVFDPAITLIVWGSLALGFAQFIRRTVNLARFSLLVRGNKASAPRL